MAVINISMFLTRVTERASGECRMSYFATTRRKILQPRGEKFYNHEEVEK